MREQHAVRAGGWVKVDGRRVYVVRAGSERHGSDAVTFVLEAARGWHSEMYIWFVEALAEYGQVVAYDRSGLGRSEPAPTGCDGNSRMEELHDLIVSLSLRGPLVLVGHSIGGLYARLYAHRYPGEVAGIVLVDATHDLVFDVVKEHAPLSDRLRVIGAKFAKLLGVRHVGFLLRRECDPAWSTLAGSSRKAIQEMSRDVYAILRDVEEGSTLAETSKQARDAGALGELPLLVVTAGVRTAWEARRVGDVEKFMALWRLLQRDLLTLSRHSAQYVIAEAGHCNLVTDSRYAREACDRIGKFALCIQISLMGPRDVRHDGSCKNRNGKPVCDFRKEQRP